MNAKTSTILYMRVSAYYTENKSNKNGISENSNQMKSNVNGTFGYVSSIYFAQ